MHTYRDTLKVELAKRRGRNSNYSLRSFARDIELLPTRLSDILNKKQGLSKTKAEEVVSKLGLAAAEEEHFILSVESLHARSKVARELANIKLKKYSNDPSHNLSSEAFSLISDWYHFAILELTQLKGFKSELVWIAKKLDLSKIEVELAIKRLVSFDLLREEDGKFLSTGLFFASPSETPSDAIKKYHEQVLKKAADSLYFQGVDERDFSAVNMALNKKDIPIIKKKIKDFRRSLVKYCEGDENKNELYCFSAQLFRLTTKNIK